MSHRFPSFRQASACLAFLLAGAASAAVPPGSRSDKDEVILTGWLHVEDHTWRDAKVSVEVDGVVNTAQVSETGRFDLRVPANTEVLLRFEKPEHLTKEVVVNTAHSAMGQAGRNKRHVRFAVILELERHMAGFSYHSPVGNIGFDPDGGCLAVTHRREKIPPGRNKPMEF
ncbi:MAG: hypothetical protein IPM12_15570 [Flavobacteriales bacterium]|nr:hypothetical protein [Flavobacteriales bacterium]